METLLVGVCGRNGAGKSTVIGLLTGALESTTHGGGYGGGKGGGSKGEILRNRNLVVASYSQQFVAELQKMPGECALSYMTGRHPGISEQDLRAGLSIRSDISLLD